MSSSFHRTVGTREIVIETGRLAQQANGSILIRTGDSVVLVTAVMDKPREGLDFFPLTIDYEERLYARGKIPGSFFRREGRPTTDAILTDRLTDRPLRPLFPEGFRNDVQITATALSSDQENPLDLLVLIGASAALSISDIPFGGPIGATRVGYIDGKYIINPSYQEQTESLLDLVVAGSRDGVSMMEAGVNELSEEIVLEAIKLGQAANLEVIALQDEMVNALGQPKAEYHSEVIKEDIRARIDGVIGDRLADALEVNTGKSDQATRLKELENEVVEALKEEFSSKEVSQAFDNVLEHAFRTRVIDSGLRPDGRGLRELRQLDCDTSILPRTHGSGLFQRGETQVLGIVTLGSVGDAQRIDSLEPNDSKRFMLHYNFPPFSTGETGRLGSTNRRSIGHGALAERALEAILPSEEEFPYVIRLVAEVLSSNGSTSMGSVCAGTLALMDAGVPIKAPVAGISIGLVTGDDGTFSTLTDIQGMEDHYGDMDFKVAGTADGITAIQLDIKIQKIDFSIIEAALIQAREARLAILDRMGQAISTYRADMSPYAPRMTRIMVPVSKIGAVIGPGGKMIRSIIEETKASVDVQDDGTVIIGSTDALAAEKAVQMIESLTKEAKVGDVFTGKVVRIMPFGAFVEILPGQDGMVHISELSGQHVATVEDEVEMGEEITVQVIRVDPSGKIALSRRSLMADDGGAGSSHDRRETPAGGGSRYAGSSRQPSPRSQGGRRDGDNRGNRRSTDRPRN